MKYYLKNKKKLLCYVAIILLNICSSLRANKNKSYLYLQPEVSIITSVYKGDKFIEGFLKDITSQSMFNRCELILINANSPDNEESTIRWYVQRYPNIIYIRLDKDPGLYAVWNYAIKIASGNFITNANIDDRRSKDSIETLYNEIIKSPDIDLVYASYHVTKKPNQTFETHDRFQNNISPSFSKQNMQECIPGPFPLWRKSMHKKYGYFNETYKSAGDWEMWLRAVSQGSIFKKINYFSGLYYLNPKGLSTDVASLWHMKEVEKLREIYKFVWS